MNINNSNKTLFRFNHNLKEYIIKVKMLYYIFNVYLECLFQHSTDLLYPLFRTQ